MKSEPSRAYFRFYAELNDFLPSRQRQVTFSYTFARCNTVKHLIEALGVPHTEVDLILVNGAAVDFAYMLCDGDRVSVYPVFESLDISSVTRVRPRPLRVTRFVLDTHLGKLAAYLRMLGFDTRYRNDYADAELARVSSTERRILLTKDRGLLKRGAVTHGYCVRASAPRQQLAEVLQRFDLYGAIAPFCRCVRCNGVLEKVDKEEIADRLPPRTQEYYDEFFYCSNCDHVYWKGSHYAHMREFIDEVVRDILDAQ